MQRLGDQAQVASGGDTLEIQSYGGLPGAYALVLCFRYD
jgi:hypothetical protein